jgi:hypothetical protein
LRIIGKLLSLGGFPKNRKFVRAQMLLKADPDGPGWADVKIAEAFNCRVQTIENLRKRLVMEGFALALEGKQRPEPPTPCKLDGEAEAKLIARRLRKPPAGYGHWTLQLLADAMVALEILASSTISPIPNASSLAESTGLSGTR